MASDFGDRLPPIGRPGEVSLEEAVAKWASAVRADDRAQERARERWLRQSAEEDATLAGTLVDMAERGRAVGIHTLSGRVHRGQIIAVGADFVLAKTETDTDVIVPFEMVGYVRPEPGERPMYGDRALTIDLLFGEALHEFAIERPRVLVVLRGDSQSIAGTLRFVGADVLSLRLDGSSRSTATVPLLSIAEISAV